MLLRPLLLVLAVLGLLGSGGVEPAPRVTGAPVVSVLASAAGPAVQRATPAQRAVVHRAPVHRAPVHRAPVHRAPVHRAPVHRAPVHSADSRAPGTVTRAGYAIASVPSSGGADLPPGAGTHLATHPLAAELSRPPSAPHVAAVHDAAAGRAPPTTTGT